MRLPVKQVREVTVASIKSPLSTPWAAAPSSLYAVVWPPRQLGANLTVMSALDELRSSTPESS